MDKKKSRSEAYQYLLVEKVFSNEMMESFSNNDSISSIINPFQYDETLMDLQEQLKKEFWRIVDDNLTERQKEVMHLYSDGYTQMEIAKMLNVNQSSITKSLHGNTDYKNNKISYGGCIKKLKKIIENDIKVINILREMDSIREQKW